MRFNPSLVLQFAASRQAAKTFFAIFFLLAYTALQAQNERGTDTLEWARAKAYSRQFDQANELLQALNKGNPTVHSLHLHAQVLYWMKRFDASLRTFEKAVAAFPEQKELVLDYGRTLFNLGKYSKSREVLTGYLLSDAQHEEANVLLAYAELWNGQLSKAKWRSQELLQHHPGNAEAKKIADQVKLYSAPFFQLSSTVYSDDQPLIGSVQRISSGWFQSRFFSPQLDISYSNIKASDTSHSFFSLSAANSMRLNYSKTIFYFAAGIFNANETLLTGKLGIEQKLGQAFSVQASLERSPYLYTAASVVSPFLLNLYTTSIGIDSRKFNAKAGYQVQQFDDENRVTTVYSWMLLPLLKKEKVQIHTGYAFSFANSDYNQFRSKKGVQQLASPGNINKQVDGVYDPYFTPQNQIVHSILSSLKISMGSAVSFSARGSLGLFAQADNPVLTVKNINSQYTIQKTFAVQRYTPAEVVTELSGNARKRLKLSASYKFNSLFFYTLHSGEFGLKYQLL